MIVVANHLEGASTLATPSNQPGNEYGPRLASHCNQWGLNSKVLYANLEGLKGVKRSQQRRSDGYDDRGSSRPFVLLLVEKGEIRVAKKALQRSSF